MLLTLDGKEMGKAIALYLEKQGMRGMIDVSFTAIRHRKGADEFSALITLEDKADGEHNSQKP
tara:strand:- start:269 stop:457 length:189 start_codon:yes stop_codon:yes gene_type:complete